MYIFVLIILCFNLSSFCLAQEDNETEQEINRFSLVEYKEGGEKNWELCGISAEVKDEFVKIDGISALVFGEDTVVELKARRGDFNKKTQIEIPMTC